MTRRFLNNYFSCHSKIDILRTVINSEDPLSGRQIAAKAGLSPRSCQLSLDELVRLNALNRKASGKAYYYSVNLDNHIVTDLIIPIIQQEERLTQSMVDSLRQKFTGFSKDVKGIYYLESWPRAWGGKDTSARLMAVLKNNHSPRELEDQLDQVCSILHAQYGLESDYLVFSSEEFTEKVVEKPAALKAVQRRLKKVSGDEFETLVDSEKGSPLHIKKAVDFFPKRRKVVV